MTIIADQVGQTIYLTRELTDDELARVIQFERDFYPRSRNMIESMNMVNHKPVMRVLNKRLCAQVVDYLSTLE